MCYHLVDMIKGRPIQIITERLVLRSLDESDKDVLFILFNDTQVKKTYMIPDLGEEKMNNLLDRIISLSTDKKHFVYGITFNHQLVGFMNDVSIENKEIEVGYFISSKEWNKGYASEALTAAVDVLFDMGFEKVKAAHFENNLASGRVMEKAGMHKVGLGEVIEYRGQKHQCIDYEIIKNE